MKKFSLLKMVEESKQNLDQILDDEHDPNRLKIFFSLIRTEMKFYTGFFHGQKILRELKEANKSTTELESIIGPLLEKNDLKALREMEKQMKEKILILKEKLKNA
jgi:hypothetical protein